MSAQSAIGRFFRAVDQRDWDAVRAGLAARVTVDYTALFGGEVEEVTRSELVDRWASMLPGFDATQHFVGPLIETADGRHEANVRGYHHLDDETWMVAGWYVLATTRGSGDELQLSGIQLQVTYETGSRQLIERAQARAATS